MLLGVGRSSEAHHIGIYISKCLGLKVNDRYWEAAANQRLSLLEIRLYLTCSDFVFSLHTRGKGIKESFQLGLGVRCPVWKLCKLCSAVRVSAIYLHTYFGKFAPLTDLIRALKLVFNYNISIIIYVIAICLFMQLSFQCTRL